MSKKADKPTEQPEQTQSAQSPSAEVAPSIIAPEEVTAPVVAETAPVATETTEAQTETNAAPSETKPVEPKKKLKVGETKSAKIEVDRLQFAKLVKACAHGYSNYYSGLAGVRIFAKMGGVTSGNYDDEVAFHSKMLEEAEVDE